MFLPFFTPTMRTADPSLGRFDYHALPDQARMEMLVDGLSPKEKKHIQDSQGGFQDVCQWKYWYDSLTACTDERVTSVCFRDMKFRTKQFPFALTPERIEEFTMSHCALNGTLNTAVLPPNILEFNVGNNNLHGNLNFSAFPRNIERIYIYGNLFTGSCMLSDLPQTVVVLNARNNKFSGEIALNSLPRAMEDLFLYGNALEGSITIRNLPKAMRVIRICRNAFSGEFRLLSFPPELEKIDIGHNNFTPTAVVSEVGGKMHFELVHNSFTSVVDEEGSTHPWESDILMK